ncbi:hypothetical protein DOM21_18995 [Bacteriovorax stolpii]|uniref:porin n=1 Tax=Bacteriovorax stolpii TaxID=960 RepID=UPI0011582735|nr:porin [Bacteriovorax stolpii]QDK43504.1 hypothetical protein DOM21_18995 [Bacteriovorax stolpii]
MKKMLTFAAIAAVSTSAHAFDYKFNLEGRADFISANTKTTSQAGTTTEAKQNGFLSNLIRLNMMGNINDTLSYRMRYRFNKENANTDRDDSTTNLDYLYVDHKNQWFTTRFGKTNWAEAYGRESFISSTDLYLATAAYTAYNDNIGNYRFGVSATYTFLETHKLTLAISNPNKAKTDTTGETKNTSLAYGIHYSSVMFDKMFQPTLSYTLAAQDGDAQATTPTTKGDFTMMAAGFRTEAAGFIVDADWKQFKKEKRTTAGADDKTSSIFANVSYQINEFSPFVQYANDKFDTDLASKATEYKKNTVVGGVMFKPFNDVNFRYHLAYSFSKQKFDAATATNKEVKDNRIIFGIKADI